MKINISGSVDTGQSFPSYVEEKFDKEITKLFDNVPSVDVSLKKQGPMISTSIVSNDVNKRGNKVNAEAEGDDAYKSFDEAFKKFISQIRKEKDKVLTKKKQGKN